MNIGYFNAQGINDIEHWFSLEQQELERRGHNIRMFYLKGNQPTVEDRDWMDFAHFHYAHVALNYRRLGVPFCISPHTNDIFPDNGEKLKISSKHKNCKFVTYQSDYHRQHYKVWDIPEPYIHLPMCCRTDLFSLNVSGVQGETVSTDKIGNIIAGGRLVPRKGLDRILPHVNNIKVFGDTKDYNYKAYLQNLNPTTDFIGHLSGEELKDFYSKAWLYLFPARIVEDGNRDGIPNTIKEALLMGLQVIASPVSGIPELKGVTFLENWDNINETIENIPRKFNYEGREYILNNFSPKVCIDKLEEGISKYVN
jgi:glycosyltransferase involved in cell wall biosynthesis